MRQDTFEALEKGANVTHNDGRVAIFDSRGFFADCAVVFLPTGDGFAVPQLWIAGELLEPEATA